MRGSFVPCSTNVTMTTLSWSDLGALTGRQHGPSMARAESSGSAMLHGIHGEGASYNHALGLSSWYKWRHGYLGVADSTAR